MVLGVIYPDSSPQTFHQAGGQSWSPVGWQNRYSYDIVRATAGPENMTRALSPQIHISEFPQQCPPHIALEVVSGLEEPGRRLSPYVLYSFFTDDLKKPHGCIRVVRIVV
jgi:hypothetical protein